MIYYTQIEWLKTLHSCKNSFNHKVNLTVSFKKNLESVQFVN